MRLLLDSHAVYWWMTGSAKLSTAAREMTSRNGHVALKLFLGQVERIDAVVRQLVQEQRLGYAGQCSRGPGGQSPHLMELYRDEELRLRAELLRSQAQGQQDVVAVVDRQ